MLFGNTFCKLLVFPGRVSYTGFNYDGADTWAFGKQSSKQVRIGSCLDSLDGMEQLYLYGVDMSCFRLFRYDSCTEA